MIQCYSHLRSISRRWIVGALLTLVAALGSGNSIAWGQSIYTCFPTCDETDARFLSVAGTGLQTLAGQTITMTITSPEQASSLEIGFFDGETGGRWDNGTTPTIYTLYADPNANGTGTLKVGEWRGDSMTDNAWYSVTVNNVPQARSAAGTYFYLLHVRALDTATASWSNFKIRTNGTINLRPNQAFNVTAPLPNLATAQIVFPQWPSLDSTTYDGSWTFYLYVPTPTQSLIIWDGDMDHGAYDCSAKDEDDPDTRNEDLPSWAPGTSAVREGIATSSLRCTNGDTATANPTDDSQSATLRRSPSVIYEIIDPDGNYYANNNPSGNLEWEQFKISVAPFDREQMDYHAESLPAGIYRVYMTGMDMQNLNAWRFGNPTLGVNPPYIVGVDAAGSPVIPPTPVKPDTAKISGVLFFDQNSNGTRDVSEMPIDGIRVIATADFDNNGSIDWRDTTFTDANGAYNFGGLKAGVYTISVDAAAIGSDATPTYDRDGISTPGRAKVTIDNTNQSVTANFGYKRTITGTLSGADTVMGSASTKFSVHGAPAGATYQWSITGSGSISGSTTGSSATVNTSNFGTFTVSVKITHDGISTTLKKTVSVAGIDFALFAYEYLSFKGRSSSDTSRGVINGNVGVNNSSSSCRPSPVLDLGGSGCGNPNGVYVGNGYRVMADYVDLSGSKVSVYDLYANRTTSSSSAAKKRNSGPIGFTLPIIRSRDLPTIPSFSYNSTNITINCNASRTLAPGQYGIITIKDGGDLILQNGIYNIKSIRAGNNATIMTAAGSKVRIARDLIIGDNGYVGPHNGALFIVRSDGICDNDPSVDFSYRTEFHGQVFAPNGKIDLGRKTNLTGRFWGKIITSDYDVNVTYYSPVTLLSRSNNDGFQKRKLNPTTGAEASIALEQNYPNPFTQSTTISYTLAGDADVTLRIVDMQGNVVRTLAEKSPVNQGSHTMMWDGNGDNGTTLPSGTYFCTMQAGEAQDMIPLVLVRD